MANHLDRRAVDQPNATTTFLERLRVLVVDDEPSILRFASRALDVAGYTVTTASNGAEALCWIDEHGCADLFILDLAMPAILGTELAGLIRAAHPQAKVLYLTGYSDRLFDEKRTLWSDEAFLEKSAEIAALLEDVSLLLFGHTHRPEPAS
jgi:two-component system cell cycle sensor histidine kinase/response regulator CckA